MMSFKQFCLDEGRGYPGWVKAATLGMTMKVRGLSNQIQTADDTDTKVTLLSRQNNLLAYLLGLSIGIDTKDKGLMSRSRGVGR